MYGLSSYSKEQIKKKIEDLFDNAAFRSLGPIPKLHHKIIPFLGLSGGGTLASLFVQALGNRYLSNIEQDVLKGILDGAYSYINILKNKTSNDIIQQLEGMAREARFTGKLISEEEIMNVIQEGLNKASSGLKTIIAAEGTKTRNLGTALEITKIAAKDGEKDPIVGFSVIRDNSTCESCVSVCLMDDGITPKLYHMSELSAGYFKRGDKVPSILGQHPHCFVNKNAHVYTEHKGYLRIDKIKIGDKVLTHTGKFKTVLNTLEKWDKPYNGKMIKVYFEGTTLSNGPKNSTVKGQKLCVTPEHQFLTSVGWKEAKYLTDKDELMQLFTNCSTCNIEIPVKWGYKKRNNKYSKEHFCSRKCFANFQWKNEEHIKNISEKSSKQMKEWSKNNPELAMERIKKANKAVNILIEKGEFWAQKKESKEFLGKHRAYLNSLNPRVSKEEKVFIEKIKEFYPKLETQKLKYIFTVDGVIEELKVIIEYDGGGHYLPVLNKSMTMENFLKKQSGRDKYLNKCGYHVLRYGPGYNIKSIIEDIERVSKNSTSKYFFKPLKINKIENGTSSNQKLYDLTVEDDESFVVNGIISHNCRCTLFTIPKGYGFDSKGHITFVSLEHSELDKQRKT